MVLHTSFVTVPSSPCRQHPSLSLHLHSDDTQFFTSGRSRFDRFHPDRFASGDAARVEDLHFQGSLSAMEAAWACVIHGTNTKSLSLGTELPFFLLHTFLFTRIQSSAVWSPPVHEHDFFLVHQWHHLTMTPEQERDIWNNYEEQNFFLSLLVSLVLLFKVIVHPKKLYVINFSTSYNSKTLWLPVLGITHYNKCELCNQICFQVTSTVTHYFLILMPVILFSHLLTDSSPVPVLREIKSNCRGIVCAV